VWRSSGRRCATASPRSQPHRPPPLK
jgi:hypothetical protein